MKIQVLSVAAISALATVGAIALLVYKGDIDSLSNNSGRATTGGSVSALTIAVRKDPENLILLKRLARAYRQAGNRQKAIENYLAAARIEPSDAESNNALRALTK